MTDAAVHHSSFTIERELAVPARRVFDAFANPDLKARWFGSDLENYTIAERSMDFRPGGKERLVGEWKSGRRTDFQGHYFDILEGRRITYVYEMFVDGRKLSVSLATIEVEPTGTGSHLTVTEQGAYFGKNGAQDAIGREHGTNMLMGMLEASLADPS